MTEVWCTKYALSNGITRHEVVHRDGSYVWIKWPNGLNGEMMCRSSETHITYAVALSAARDARDKKIKSLRKQITKLEKLFPEEMK